MKLFFVFILIHCFLWNVCAQNPKQSGKDYSKYLYSPKIYINKDSTPILHIDKYHPHLFESLSAAERDSLEKLIHNRKQLYPGDSITLIEHFHLWKPLIDRLNYEDPHYYVIPQFVLRDKKYKVKDVPVIPIRVLIIGDTVIVDKSLTDLLHKGDRLLSINHIPIENFLGISRERYLNCALLQHYHHLMYAPKYDLEIERKGRKLAMEIEGMGYGDVTFGLVKDTWKKEIYDDYEVGYFDLDNFYPNNSLLINHLAKFIKEVQKKGYKNVIIDTRRNPGGYGHKFDELFSLFINKDTIAYTSGSKIRVSKLTLKSFNLPEDSIGQLIDLPHKYNFRNVPLHPKKYLGPMNYYILISRSTQSMASSFVNVLQYHGVAQLVGEPLHHNALKYGDVDVLYWGDPSNIEMYSTVQTNEYTRSEDGQIYPDIEIPYIAKEYIQSDDPMLEKLLNYIKTKK